MPIIECSCGMVMSISVATPRNTCIRCGGVEFRELERFNAVVNATICTSLVPVTSVGNCFLMPTLAAASKGAIPTAVGWSLEAAREDLLNPDFSD